MSRAADLTILPLSDLPMIEQRIARCLDAYDRVTGRGDTPAPALLDNLYDGIAVRANILRPFDAYAPGYARNNAAALLASHGTDAVRRQYGPRP